ncbi:MAG: S-layer homology domain-containing protein, partial [Neofamilia sp.]
MLKNKKFVVLLLCLVILAQSAVAMAVSFPDVTKDNNSGWAYEYITELANKGIIKGYDDGTYKPENNVTYLETLSLLNGVMSPTRTEINESLTKYRTFLNSNNTPEWALEIAAVALNRGVVQESEYSRANAAKMIELGTKVSISRYDVAVFTARALELQPKSA